MDEVISPTLTIKVVGLFSVDGLKLNIINKMKDTSLIGQKNNISYHSIQHTNKFYRESSLISEPIQSKKLKFNHIPHPSLPPVRAPYGGLALRLRFRTGGVVAQKN